MTEETRVIKITTQVGRVERDLLRIADTIDKIDGATGKSDKQLRALDATLARLKGQVTAANKEMTGLYDRTNALSKANTAFKNQAVRLTSQLETQSMAIRSQREQIKALLALNKSLSAEASRGGGERLRTVAQLNEAHERQLFNLRREKSELHAKWKAESDGAKQATAALKPFNEAQERARFLQQQQAAQFRRGLAQEMGLGGMDDGPAALTNALRYQLYDVAATFGILGAAVVAASTSVTRAGIEWDKNFANVIRTSQVTGTAIGWLREEFLQLQEAIPVSSADLATIATLGAQMGVAAANLTNFTETTAQFSATAGISVDEAATALSRLDQLLPDVNGNYELLASTILKTGVNAVATEQAIVRGTNQIAAMGRIAGLSTPEIIGLASAMSSLGFSPELSRSIVTSSFSRILTATSQVTEQTEKFGAVLNMTGKEFQQAWNSDAIGTYRDLLQTIASRGDAVSVLQSLGLASQRLTPNLLKLGQNTEVLNEALADTNLEWGQNTELARQYGIISTTVSAKIQVLAQTWEALLVTLDESDTIIGPLIDGLSWFLRVLRQAARTPGVSMFVSLASAIGVLAGVMALGAAGLAAMSAGYIAIVNAQAGLAAATGVSTASTVANTAVTAANTTVRMGGVNALVLHDGALLSNTALTTQNTAATVANGAAMSTSGAKLLGFSSTMIGALPNILRFTGLVGLAAAGLGALAVTAANIPTMAVDLIKLLEGADTPTKVFDIDLKSLENLQSTIAAYEEAVNPKDSETKVSLGTQLFGGQDIAEMERLVDANKQDLVDEVLALGDLEEQYAAVNYIAKRMGVTQEDLLTNIIPDLGSALGDGAIAAAEMQEATEKLEASQAIWAATLLTTDEQLAGLMENLQGGAAAFFDFGDAMQRAYDTSGDPGTGGGIDGLLKNIQGQVTNFESFYDQLGELVQRGGINLASGFAAQGPAAMQALTDALALTPDQIAQVEENMSLAAFYASEEFAQTFAQNNAILAEVWRQTNSTEAVAAFNDALANSMQGGSVDPTVLAQLADQFGIELNAQIIPSIDSDTLMMEMAIFESTPIQVPVESVVTGATIQTQQWIVEMEGNKIVLPVDPNTEEGRLLLQEWRDSEYQTPVKLPTAIDTTRADEALRIWMARERNLYVGINATYGFGAPKGTPVAKAKGGGIGIPGYAGGTSAPLRGPGTTTSDSILARLSKGEWVHNARAVAYYGPEMMDAINRMRFPKFATGGFVGGPGSSGATPGTIVNATVIQNYPTTQDPIKKLRDDAESVIAGIWV